MKEVTVIENQFLRDCENQFFLFECPHCSCLILVAKDEVNCRIFRHGTYKSTGCQMEPHTPKAECDRLFETGEIWGCGKPFHMIGNDKRFVEICDYI